jgi:hypothetical protein
MKSRLITSFFNGKCRICGKDIPKGAQCWFAKHYGARCEACGPHTVDDQPLPRKAKGGRKGKAPRDAQEKPTGDGARPRRAAQTIRPMDAAWDFSPAKRRAVKSEDGIHRIEYGSIREIVEEALSDHAQTDGTRERLRALQERSLSGEDRWANHFTRARLLEQISSPPAALTEAIDAMRERLAGEVDLPTRPRRKIRRGQDWGETLDADRWLGRDPSPWERVERIQQERRLVQIGCNLSVHCKVKPAQLLYRGAAALALADFLTQQGCSVGVTLFKTAGDVTSEVRTGVVRCVVKRPDMPMDLSALAFSMCEIAFFRCALLVAAARRWPGRIHDGL